MPLKHILGADHVVVTVRDLDASARAWGLLGFTEIQTLNVRKL